MKGSLLSAAILEPYAEALMSVAQSNDLVDRFSEDIASILNLMESSEDLREFMGSPIVADDKKKAVWQQIGSDIHPFILNFLMVLVDRRRSLFIEGVFRHFQSLVRKLKQTVLAEVISTVELSDEQRQSVSEKVKSMTNANQVELDNKIDSNLLGGVIIKVGSQVVDASLRGQLRRIGVRLNQAS